MVQLFAVSLHHTRNHEWTGADDIHPPAVEHKKITRGIGLSVAGSIGRRGDLRQRGKHQHSQSTPWPNFMIRGGTDILGSRGARPDLALALRDCHQTDERALLVQLQVRTNAGSEDLMEAAAADSDLRGSRTREKVTQRPSVRSAAGPLLSSPLAPPRPPRPGHRPYRFPNSPLDIKDPHSSSAMSTTNYSLYTIPAVWLLSIAPHFYAASLAVRVSPSSSLALPSL